MASLAVAMVAAPVAAADTLPARDSAFTPSQVAADQYTGPPAPPGGGGGGGGAVLADTQGAPNAPAAEAEAEAEEEGSAGDRGGDDEERGLAGDRADDGPAGGVSPALVEEGATAPRRPSGELPFTGGDLLALVWIALALIAAGCAAAALRRWLEDERAAA